MEYKLVYDNQEDCQNALDRININMNNYPPNSWDVVRMCNNEENEEMYGKWYIGMVEGDEYHHQLWLTNVYEKSEEHPEGYILLEYNPDWMIIPEI